MILINVCVNVFCTFTALTVSDITFSTLTVFLSSRQVRKEEWNEAEQDKRNLRVCQVDLEDLENLEVPVDRKTAKGACQNI